MKGKQLKSCRTDLSLGGSTNPAENCCIPSREKGDAGKGHCSSRIPFFPFWQWAGYSNDRVFSPVPARTGPSCQQTLPFGASGSQSKLPGDGGLQLFAAALVFCAPKGGAVTFLKQLMAGLTSSLPSVA